MYRVLSRDIGSLYNCKVSFVIESIKDPLVIFFSRWFGFQVIVSILDTGFSESLNTFRKRRLKTYFSSEKI